MNRHSLFILILAASLGGCTLMPEYEQPPAPVSAAWPVDAEQTPETGAAADEIGWREFFADPRLRELIDVALNNNRDLRVAALRVEEARARYRIRRADLYPGAQGEAGFTRQRFSGAVTAFSGGRILDNYDLEVQAAYEVDLFGRVRSLKREALERYFATEEARTSVEIALVSEVASQYLTLVRLREAKNISRQTLESVERSFELNKRRFEAGVASELEVQTALSQVQAARVDIARYTQLVAQAENALVLLLGQTPPAGLPPALPFERQGFLAEPRAGIPSEILGRRPDILAAEHELKAANANIGAARAAFFPRIVLTGAAGTASAELSDLFTGPAATWRYSPQITIPIFEFGSTRANLDVSKITKKIEIAHYEKVIQTAFREVADALAVRSILEDQLDAQRLLLDAQQKRFDLTEARYRQGVDDYVDVLLAQQSLYEARQGFLELQSARLLNTIALYRSLGGSWKS